MVLIWYMIQRDSLISLALSPALALVSSSSTTIWTWIRMCMAFTILVRASSVMHELVVDADTYMNLTAQPLVLHRIACLPDPYTTLSTEVPRDENLGWDDEPTRRRLPVENVFKLSARGLGHPYTTYDRWTSQQELIGWRIRRASVWCATGDLARLFRHGRGWSIRMQTLLH